MQHDILANNFLESIQNMAKTTEVDDVDISAALQGLCQEAGLEDELLRAATILLRASLGDELPESFYDRLGLG